MNPVSASTTSAVRYSLLPSTRRTNSLGSAKVFEEEQSEKTSPPGAKLPHHRSNESISRLVAAAAAAPSSPRWRRLGLAVLLCVSFAGIVGLVSGPAKLRHANASRMDPQHRIPVDFETKEVPSEWKCNPFKEPGRLQVDTENKYNNVWRPYDEDCPTSQMFQGLIRAVNKTREREQAARPARSGPLRAQDTTTRLQVTQDGIVQFPWLVNATVLLIGDSMERLHLNDFCDLVGGEATNINPMHVASPPPFHKSIQPVYDRDGSETPESKMARQERKRAESEWENREHSWYYTRPWICDVKEYNFTLINTFTWGMEDMELVFQTEDFFHAPSTWLERFHHIALPLLHNLATYLGRPQIANPTLIEIASGYWDLRGMTEQDFIAAGYSKPYPKDSDIAFGPIGRQRELKWVKNVQKVVKDVARTFSGPYGIRSGPPILWRTMHHVKRNNYTPYSRVTPLDALARKTMHELRVSSLATHPTFLSSMLQSLPYYQHARKYFSREALEQIRRTKEQEEDSLEGDETDYGFDERLRVDEIGKLLEGQENHMRDFLHPEVLPGSYIWADILLYEIKRAYYRVGRSDLS